MSKIISFTGGLTVPSARFRVRQYISPLEQSHGITVREVYPRAGNCPPESRVLRPLWAVQTLAEMMPNVWESKNYDAVLLQRTVIPTFTTLEVFTARPRILDVDDAIHLARGGRFARELAERCDRIICGNDYLAECFGRWNKNINVLATAVDSDKYCPASCATSADEVIIGWIGTNSNLKYLESIERALIEVLNTVPTARLHVICDRPPLFSEMDPDRFRFFPWSEADEVANIQRFSVGIMPLEDSLWAKGKCSFKMLQYMSCAVPVVVSPVGMNAQVLAHGGIGYGASSHAEWTTALVEMLRNRTAARAIGQRGREVVSTFYSLSALSPKLAQILTNP